MGIGRTACCGRGRADLPEPRVPRPPFRDLAADTLCLHPVDRLSLLEPGADPGRVWQADAVHSSRHAFRRIADGVPATLRDHHRVFELEPLLATRPAI